LTEKPGGVIQWLRSFHMNSQPRFGSPRIGWYNGGGFTQTALPVADARATQALQLRRVAIRQSV
jgi:hypothetical protein